MPAPSNSFVCKMGINFFTDWSTCVILFHGLLYLGNSLKLAKIPHRQYDAWGKLLCSCIRVCAGVSSQSLTSVKLFETPQIIAQQSPLPLEFFRQVHECGLPFSTSGDLCNSGIEPRSLVSPALSGRFFTTIPILGLYLHCPPGHPTEISEAQIK